LSCGPVTILHLTSFLASLLHRGDAKEDADSLEDELDGLGRLLHGPQFGDVVLA